MGLMKISTYHKMLGDEVHFVKGTNPSIDAEVWDRIYVTTLFTFDFAISVKTINHYMHLVNDVDSLYVGGIMASLMPDKVIDATGIKRSHILTGLFTDTSVVGDNNDINVDQLPLDYDILEEIDYEYPAGDNYFAYTTRGCPNHCSFCAVPILEPNFHVTNNIIEQINTIWQETMQESLGSSVDMSQAESAWVYIHHFFDTPFYVYSYAASQCLVNALYQTNKNGEVANFKEKYVHLLKNPQGEHYFQLLKADFGLDMEQPSFWLKGLQVIEDKITELETLSKEIF